MAIEPEPRPSLFADIGLQAVGNRTLGSRQERHAATSVSRANIRPAKSGSRNVYLGTAPEALSAVTPFYKLNFADGGHRGAILDSEAAPAAA